MEELLYDDCCHLKSYSEKKSNANQNEITKHFAKLGKHVDRFHFRNHVDPWCMENCNPEGVPILKGVNTQVCEQLFKKVNSHKNCKSFNESRFFLFFLYQFDIHNLSIDGLESKMADPREEFRWENIKVEEPDLEEYKVEEDLVASLNKLKVSPNFSCSLCGSGFTQEGYLKKHLETKHQKKPDPGPECDICGKLLANAKTLEKHVQTHLKCNKCKEEFKTVTEAKEHKRKHTYCNICHKDFHFPSKLTKHVTSVHKTK